MADRFRTPRHFDKSAAHKIESAFPKSRLPRSIKEASALAISKELLDILVCPVCKAKVELLADGSGLKCTECRRVYPIRDDIPVMLVDEARIEEDGAKA